MRFDSSTSVFSYSTMKHKNGVGNMVGCLQVVRIYSFRNEIEVYIYTSYIVFLYVTICYMLYIYVIRAFIAW